MDRFVPRSGGIALGLALTLSLGLGWSSWPAAPARAALPTLREELAGDPGDGVLRPAETAATSGTAEASAPTSRPPVAGDGRNAGDLTSPTWLLVPVIAPTGHPCPLSFLLVRLEGDLSADRWYVRFPGRWHRAP